MSFRSEYSEGQLCRTVHLSSQGSHSKGHAGDEFSFGPVGLLPGAAGPHLSGDGQEPLSTPRNESPHSYIWGGSRHLKPLPVQLVQMGLLSGSVGVLPAPKGMSWSVLGPGKERGKRDGPIDFDGDWQGHHSTFDSMSYST